MAQIKWRKTGWRSYEAVGEPMTIMYFQNARAWRLDDSRGASPATPKPLEHVLIFRPTLAAAKQAAEDATWHLTIAAPAAS